MSASTRARVARHRDLMRSKGYRLVQVWVPDVRSQDFARIAHEQSLAVASSPTERDDQDFVEAISVTWDE